MAANHECVSCTGIKHDGANLKCQMCLKPTFIDCLVKGKRNEVMELMHLMNGNQNIGTPIRLQNKLLKIFNDSSQFMFICLQCKNKRPLVEIIEEQAKQINVELITKNDDLEKELQNTNIQLVEMNEENAKLKDEIEQTKNRENNEDMQMDIDNKGTENMVENMMEHMKRVMKNEMAIMLDDIEARIKLECEKMKEELGKKLGDTNENSLRMKKCLKI